MKKILSIHNKGFTLIELIITIPIMLIVLALIFSVGDFGNKLYKNTNIKMNNQDAVRLVGDYIKKDIRSAKIVNSSEDIVKANNTNATYFALSYTGNHLVKQIKKNSDKTLISQAIIGDTLTNLSFLITTDKGMLKYKVIDNSNGQNYSITYEVILDNIADSVNIDTLNASGVHIGSTTTIYYANN